MQEQQSRLLAAIERQHTGLVCKLLHQQFRHLFRENAAKAGLDDVTLSNGRILGYLERQQDPVFQKDIESEFHIARSTVTATVQLMEKHGWIERRPVQQDSRLKQVCLTHTGRTLHNRIVEIIEYSEKQMLEGIGAEEIHTFYATVLKIEKNLTRR